MKVMNSNRFFITHNSVAAICPHCNWVEVLGKIEFKISIQSPESPEIPLAPVGANPLDSMVWECPCCNTKMYTCDGNIARGIAALNSIEGVHTRFSCEGHLYENWDAVPYVTFTDNTIRELIMKAYTVEEVGDEIIFKSRYTKMHYNSVSLTLDVDDEYVGHMDPEEFNEILLDIVLNIKCIFPEKIRIEDVDNLPEKIGLEGVDSLPEKI